MSKTGGKEAVAENERRVNARPRVFYDGGCPMCRREIDQYRRLDREQRLDWIDITRQSEDLARHGLTYEAAMSQFHVLNSNGEWQTGAQGFAEMWAHLPYFHWLARAIRRMRLLTLLDTFYRIFARWRARRRCTEGSCSTLRRGM